MFEDKEIRLTAFEYAVNILSKPEISSTLKEHLDVFDLAEKIYNYLNYGKQQ